MKRLLFPLILAALLIALIPVLAQSGTPGTINVELNVRAAPGTSGAVILQAQPGTRIVVEGRNDAADWLYVRAEDGSFRGWVTYQYVALDTAIRLTDLPLVDPNAPTGSGAPPPDAAPADPNAPTSVPTWTPAPERIVIEATIAAERLDLPALNLSNAAINNARTIFRRGQARGNNPNDFMKIGESNTAGTVFLCPFHYGSYDLASFGTLAGVIGQFQPSGSFCRFNVTAQTGYSTGTLLDDTWAAVVSPDCQAGETPIDCEYRLHRSSYAVIYIGIADQGFYTERQFRDNLNAIIRDLSNYGVVPILTTYPMDVRFNDGKPQSFNTVIRDVASRGAIPLIDLRAALVNYPNWGTGEDGYHLSYRDPAFTSFGGDQNTHGRALRELLTLQMLEALVARAR
jgi:hypothetical protein